MKYFQIKCLLLFCIIIASSSFLKSQNLINNPGFENGLTQWNGFWSRDGAGSGTLVSNPVHSGTKAVKISYAGTQDWAFSTGSHFSVSPGQLYDISCWTRIDTINAGGQEQFAVVLYDSTNNALDWNYSPCIFDARNRGYKVYSARFMVPAKVKYIEPRLSGWLSCSFYVDDVSLTLDTIQSLSGDFEIENDSVKTVVHLPFLSITMTNKASLRTYNIESSPIMTVDSVSNVNAQSIIFHGKLLSPSLPHFEMAFSIENKAVQIKLIGDSSIALNSGINFPGSIFSKADEYMIIPRGTGVIVPVTNPYPYGNYNTNVWKSTMPFAGVTNLSEGYMVSTDDQWDAGFSIEKPTDQNYYTFQLNNEASKGVLGYNRTIYINLVDNGYIEMCKWYRQHAESLGYVKTLSQKSTENPNIDKLIGAVDFWSITWQISSEFLDSMKLMGLDKAIWNFTDGWGVAGYSTLIDSINAKGYLSSRYDIYTDVYPSTHPEWTWFRTEGYPADVIIDPDGQLHKGWLAYMQGQPFQGYYTCSETHLNYCMSHLPQDLSQNHYNCRFIDVELASNLTECFSEIHPATRKQDAAARKSLLNYIKNNNPLVVGDEEAHDFAFQNVDFGEGTMTMEPDPNAGYDWFNPVYSPAQSYIANNIQPTIRVPLHGLTYHDVHIPTWYTGDGATKVPDYWDDKNLWNILYGSMPLYSPPGRQYWNDHFERFIDGYHLISAITRNVGYVKMIFHQFITPNWNVQQTTFANGWSVVANFDSLPYNWNNKILAAKGFYASDGKGSEVYKLREQGSTVDWAFANNRIFFNPYGIEIAKNGVRTTGSVFIQNYGEYLLVSFIGKQNYVDLNSSLLPFNNLTIDKAYDWSTGAPVTLTDVGGGWIKLQKINSNLFYKVTLKSSSVHKLDNLDLKIFPNPAKGLLYITSDKIIKEIQISSMIGQPLYKSMMTSEEFTLDLSGFSRGVYLCKVMFLNGDPVVRKIILD
jgi:hypothetical protein